MCMSDEKRSAQTTVGEATAEDWQAEIDMMAEELCPTCLGRGTVNPLTAPPDFLCITTTTCPTCEGAGVWP